MMQLIGSRRTFRPGSMMVGLLIALSMLTGVLAAARAQNADRSPAVRWSIVHAGTLLAVPGEPPRERQSVIIRDGRIVAVRSGFLQPAEVPEIGGGDAQLIDLSHNFVLPGLIDSHVHLAGSNIVGSVAEQALSTLRLTDADRAIAGVNNARVVLLNGFTTVRDVGDPNRTDRALRDAINAGQIAGPRMLVAGPTLGPTGTQSDPAGYRPEVLAALRESVADSICDGPVDCRRAVRSIIHNGSDLLKIKASGGIGVILGRPDPRLFEDELRAMVETAHSLNVRVAAHAISLESIKAALRAGVDSIEHGTQIDDEAIQLFRRNRAYFVPTMLAPADWVASAVGSGRPVDREATARVWRETVDSVRRAHRGGVQIAFGSDIGFSRHSDAPREFLYLIEAGLSPMEAITSATVTASALLGLSQEIGVLRPGYRADIIATDASPLNDVAEFQRVSFVMRNGRIYKQGGRPVTE